MERAKDFVTREELYSNFFKINDLLSGLTAIQKLQLRANIGVLNYTNNQGSTNAVQVTSSALQTLISTSTLAVGAKYQITDFQTIYQSNVQVNNVYQSWIGNSYNLIVTANTTSTLDPNISIVEHPKWTARFDITPVMLSDGTVTKGAITYLKDENNNSAYYDFKSIKFRRLQSDLANSNLTISTNYIDLYTFSTVTNGVAIDNSSTTTTHSNEIKANCTNTVFVGDTYNNILETGCQNNTFLNGLHDSIIEWDSSNNLLNETVCYVTGAINSKSLAVGNTTLSSAITKTIHKVDNATIVSYLDPTTYTYQVVTI